jgi:ribosomal protein L21
MSNMLSENVGRLWLESTRTIPTRALQLAFERSQETYGQLTDLSIILAILKNNPCTVAPDLVAQVEVIAKCMDTSKARIVSTNNEKRSNHYSQTIDPFRAVLPKYLREKQSGLHQYANAGDCSLDLITAWTDELRSRPSTRRYPDLIDTEIVALGHSDYLRLAARAIENIPGRIWNSSVSRGPSTLRAALNGRDGFDQKSTAKLFKKLSGRAHLDDAVVPEHQDMVLMLSGDRIRIRPASLTQQAKWEVGGDAPLQFGSVHNLLSNESPVHVGLNPIEEFEALLNSKSASEADFQHFFERHPKFLLGTDYSKMISQPVLVRPDEHDLIPDFIMVPHGFARPTILELKLPTASLARHTPNREGFLQSVMTARDQLLEYRNYFSSKDASTKAKERFGCELYLPRMALVIGRSSSFVDEYERRKIESRVAEIDVMTYDDIYERALQCRRIGLL